MKDLFPGHYAPASKDIERIWQKGEIAVDTSVLLDVFRVSEETAEQILATFEQLKDQLWLPYQVAVEYHRNLEEVIADQAKPYDEAVKELGDLVAALANPRRHPFISDALLSELRQLTGNVTDELGKRKARVFDLLGSNPTKEKLAELFSGKVGPAPSESDLQACYDEGRERFSRNIPPGYIDKKDKPEPQRYGDFILWKQLLDRLKKTKRPGIFVTGDVKDDWFQRVAGRTIGPRPELVAEARAHSGVDVHIYATPTFLQWAGTYGGATINPKAIQEVRELERGRISSETRRRRFSEVGRAVQRALPGARIVSISDLSGRSGRFSVRLADGRRILVDPANPEKMSILKPHSATPGGSVTSASGTIHRPIESEIARLVHQAWHGESIEPSEDDGSANSGDDATTESHD